MRTLSLLALFYLLAPVLALPTGVFLKQLDPKKILCNIPLPQITRWICPETGEAALNRPTPLGVAVGTQEANGAYRFSVKYASAARWQPPTVVTTWALPNGFTNASSYPLPCPQKNIDPSAYSEDCLSMIFYVPQSLTLTSNAPVLFWIHGGSFTMGSASSAGLDGSKLAVATNSIVAVIQYRLGALGEMDPKGPSNLAVRDVIAALNFVRTVAPAFGGSASKITVAGQSSGAHMIRALLGSSIAFPLFRSAILDSDPMTFGVYQLPVHDSLRGYFNGLVSCGATDTACHNALSVSSILAAQATFVSTSGAKTVQPSAGDAEPLRPVLDGSLITTNLEKGGSFPATNKPILLTTTREEAGSAIFSMIEDPIPEAWLPVYLNALWGGARANTIASSPYYVPSPVEIASGDLRTLVQVIGKDSVWKCPTWTFAREYAARGGNVWTGQYNIGALYPSNQGISFCNGPDVVCHEDDIQIIFGTTLNPTTAQSAATTEVQARYKAFLANGNPNAAGLLNWQTSTSTDVRPLAIGGGSVGVGACDPAFWGAAAPYEYQLV